MLPTSSLRFMGIGLLAASASLAGVLSGPVAKADAPAAAPVSPIAVSGEIDAYYQYAFSQYNSANIISPSSYAFAGKGYYLIGTAGSIYMNRQSTPTMNYVELNLSEAPKPGAFGFKATLASGDEAAVNEAAFPNVSEEGRYQNISQLYGIYALKGANGGEVDLGKFNTPYGYEGFELSGNANIGHSDLYDILPAYHLGVKVLSPTTHGFQFAGWVVNAFENSTNEGVSSQNSDPAYIGQVTYNDPEGKYSFVENVGGGNDAPLGVTQQTFLNDTQFTFNLTSAQSLGLNYVYETQKVDGSNQVTANGFAAYVKDQINAKSYAALRYSGYSSSQTGTAGFSPSEFTATYGIKFAQKWDTRLEYRYDTANQKVFAGKNGINTEENLSSVILAEAYTF